MSLIVTGTGEKMEIKQNTTSDALEGWTKEEKFKLYQSTKCRGSHDIQDISLDIPTKSPKSIKKALDYYKKRALSQQTSSCAGIQQNHKKRKVSDVSKIPLASWARFLMDSVNYEDLGTETVVALRLIAEFDDIQPSVCTENIDFRRIYHLLANALEGKTLDDDKITKNVVNKCIIESALTSRAFIRQRAFRNIVNSVPNNMPLQEKFLFQKSSISKEAANLQNLILQHSYNPLNIPEKYLKPSFQNQDDLT